MSYGAFRKLIAARRPERSRLPVSFPRLRIAGFKSFAEPASRGDPAGPDRDRRPERLRQVQRGRGAALGDGRKLAPATCAAARWRTSSSPAPPRGRRATSPRSRSTSTRPPAEPRRHSRTAGARNQPPHRARRGQRLPVNGREVRARDVQTLFADLACGARASAMVSQGHVSALVDAKPEERRSVLEEAAGITGLHARRHEAELKLRAAEANLARAEDLRGQLEASSAALKRQARQASRYRNISGAHPRRRRRSCCRCSGRGSSRRARRPRRRCTRARDRRWRRPPKPRPAAVGARDRGRRRRCRRCASARRRRARRWSGTASRRNRSPPRSSAPGPPWPRRSAAHRADRAGPRAMPSS